MDTITPDLISDVASARTSSRTSTRSTRVEVFPHPERCRSWTTDEKRAIVAESLGPDLTTAEVARKHGLSTGQIYTWRHQLLSLGGPAPSERPQFASVELAPSPSASCAHAATAPWPKGVIEIVLPGGVLVRVDTHVDGRALRRVLGALSAR